MIDAASQFAFAGNAFLNPEPERLLDLARELGDEEFESSIGSAPELLEREYVRLFLNPGGSPCALWQSANTDDPRLMGEAHLGALEWFRRYGVEPSASNDPADHIGLLLLFYANLLRMGAEPGDLASFREKHLTWAARLFDCVEANARHPFYALLARRTRELV
jgi:TorA maturation chaperone TorD